MPDGEPPVYDPNTRRAPLTPITPQAGTYGAPAGTGASGPGFKYDRATLQELADDWKSLADEFRSDLAKANVIAGARGPGKEYASGGNAEMVRTSGSALVTTLFERQQYCREMANRFVTALGKYARAEDTHSTEIKQTGGSL